MTSCFWPGREGLGRGGSFPGRLQAPSHPRCRMLSGYLSWQCPGFGLHGEHHSNMLLKLTVLKPRTPVGETHLPSPFNVITEPQGSCLVPSRKNWSALAQVIIFPQKSLPRPYHTAHTATSCTCIHLPNSRWFKPAGDGTLSNRSCRDSCSTSITWRVTTALSCSRSVFKQLDCKVTYFEITLETVKHLLLKLFSPPQTSPLVSRLLLQQCSSCAQWACCAVLHRRGILLHFTFFFSFF